MDDTLLDGVAAMNAAWDSVCRDAAAGCGCEPALLRDAIRREGARFWADESKVGHWRLDLDGARALVVENALAAEGFDTARAREMATIYARLHREHLRPFDDAIPTLDALRAAGFHLGLLTNGPRPLQRDKIERFNFAQFFDVIVIEGEFGRGKPEREVFAHALTTVGADASEAWHIGDNLYADIAGAQSVGIHAAWIHRDRLELKDGAPAVPDRVVAHLRDVTDALGL
jgi:putative hydrolase of the HAD superfamily